MEANFEIVLNRLWLYDKKGEHLGEINFVVSGAWLFKRVPDIFPCLELSSADRIWDLLNWYDPEDEGKWIYQKAWDEGQIIDEFITIYDDEEDIR